MKKKKVKEKEKEKEKEKKKEKKEKEKFLHTAGFPRILRNLVIWVRKLTILGFLTHFTIGK